MSTALRILLIEDSEADAALLIRELQRSGFTTEFERVDTARDLEQALDRGPWDIVVGDNSMPSFTGTEALKIVRSRNADIPFIFVSGTMAEDLAITALEAGAGQALGKDDLRRLAPLIRRELRDAQDRRARRASEASYSALVQQAPVGIYRSNP